MKSSYVLATANKSLSRYNEYETDQPLGGTIIEARDATLDPSGGNDFRGRNGENSGGRRS